MLQILTLGAILNNISYDTRTKPEMKHLQFYIYLQFFFTYRMMQCHFSYYSFNLRNELLLGEHHSTRGEDTQVKPTKS